MVPLNKICTKCGVKQKRDGECWDYDECSKCFVSMTREEIFATQQEVPVQIAPSMYILGPQAHQMNVILDQALKEAHFSTPAEIEKANQNMEWVVS